MSLRLLLALLVSLATPLRAQSVEARLDGFAANPAAIQAGAGLMFVTGTYLRSGIAAGIGASQHGFSGRVDFVNRFHLDPFGEHRWAPYGGGGLTTRLDANRKTRFYLLVLAGLDGPARNGIITSVEAGLGGGGRVGVIIRRAPAKGR